MVKSINININISKAKENNGYIKINPWTYINQGWGYHDLYVKINKDEVKIYDKINGEFKEVFNLDYHSLCDDAEFGMNIPVKVKN